MMFLDFWSDPLGTILGWLGDLVGNILNILWLLLCSFVYPAVSGIMAVFTEISKLSWANYNDLDIGSIINRITLMLTIVMTFYIVFEFVKYTVSPDAISDKEKGAMPLFGRIIISILLLAFVPTIFGFANELQYRVLNTNVIGKVILGVNNGNRDIAGMGREFVGDMFSAFIVVDCADPNSSQCQSSKQAAQGVINQIKTTNLLGGTELIQWDPKIQVNGLLALIFGCFILYVMFLYCKDIALRHIQLLFLQIISPIAIISYISPKKDGMFQKWTKQCLTTYLDVFIRMAVLYFMILICNVLSKNLGIHDMTSVAGGKTNNIIVYLFLITGLMLFVKKVPKLLQEFFPSSGAASIGYGFSGKDRKLGIASRAAGAIGAAFHSVKSLKEGKFLPGGKDAYKDKKWARRARNAYGLASAMATGIKSGGKDKKMSDAFKAGGAAVQDREAITSAQGNPFLHDWFGGSFAHTLASLKLQVGNLEKQNKLAEANATMVKNVKSAQDAAEERSKSKITSGEQKTKLLEQDVETVIASLKKGDISGLTRLAHFGIEIKEGMTTSDIYAMFEAKANSIKATADAMNGQLVTAKTNVAAAQSEFEAKSPSIITSKQKLEEERNTIQKALEEAKSKEKTEENQKLIIQLENALSTKQSQIENVEKQLDDLKLKIEISQGTVKSLESDIAKVESDGVEIATLKGDALKALERYSITRIIRGDKFEGMDGALSSMIQSAMNELNNVRAQMRANPEVMKSIEAKLSTELFKVLTENIDKINDATGEYETITTLDNFKQLDDIQTALSDYASELGMQISKTKEDIRRIQESEEWQQAEANANDKK